MLNLKMKLMKTVSVLIFCLTAIPVTAAEICECGVIIGGDYLYWSPCMSNLHFAAESENAFSESQNTVSYHFIHTDWDPGFRIYLGKEDLFGCFDLMGAYTHFNSKHTGDAFDNNGNETPLLTFTWPTPVAVEDNHYATAEWEVTFERGELVVGYTIEFGKGCCLVLKPFAGVDYASICQHREDQLMDVIPRPATEEQPAVEPHIVNAISRSLDYQGIGPMVGMGYSFPVCGELITFGRASLSLLVGDADIKDEQTFLNVDNESENYVNKQKYKDRCACVPGVHLQMGLSYSARVCNMQVVVRAGYEYLQWIHAPSYLMYDMEHPGSFTGLNHNSITFQGFFGGVGLLF